MLASNGWQEASKKTIKGDHAEHIHANCDCTFAIRFDGKRNVAGYDPDKYREIYDNADGDTWQEKLNSIRRDEYAKNADRINAQKRDAYARRKANNDEKDDNIPKSEKAPNIFKAVEENNVEFREPARLSNEEISTEAIVNRIATYDRTGGSCQSAALAYVGNKAGFDVKDFRGGSSYDVMSRTSTILDIADLHGVDSTVIKSYNDFEAVTSLLKKCKAGKEYILSTGGHTAVIRKAERGYEFLELQAAYGNGYWKLTNSVLKERFK